MEHSFPREASLRNVQKEICSVFGERFPAMKADIVFGKAVFDSFIDRPFVACADGDVMEVRFQPSDDPYWYDFADRRMPKVSVDTDIEKEAAVTGAETSITPVEWDAPFRLPPIPEFALPATGARE